MGSEGATESEELFSNFHVAYLRAADLGKNADSNSVNLGWAAILPF